MIRINLLPVKHSKKEEAAQRFVALFLIGFAILLVVSGVLYTQHSSRLAELKATNQSIQTEITSLKKIIGEVEAYKQQKQVLKQKLDVIHTLKANKTGPVHMLDELATRIPDKLWLVAIEEVGGKLSIEGNSINNEVIATFMSRLEESDYFTEVYLVSIQAEETDGFKLKEFTVTARLVVPGAGGQG